MISVQLVVGGVMSAQLGAVTVGISFHFSSASAETVVIVVIEIGAIKGVYAPTHAAAEIDGVAKARGVAATWVVGAGGHGAVAPPDRDAGGRRRGRR